MKKDPHIARDRRLMARFRKGVSKAQLARQFDLSTPRVYQIIQRELESSAKVIVRQAAYGGPLPSADQVRAWLSKYNLIYSDDPFANGVKPSPAVAITPPCN